MRQIGAVTTERDAQRLADVLLAQGIKSKVEPGNEGWPVWVYDEDRVAEARSIFDRFRANPDDPGFVDAAAAAERVRTEAIARDKRIRKNIVDVRSQWTTANAAGRPLTLLLIVIAGAVSLLTNFGNDSEAPLFQRLTFVSYGPADRPGYIAFHHPFGQGSDLLKGEIWRLVTPMFLHFSPWHLLFNALALHSLGGVIEIRRGTVRFGFLVLMLAITSNTAQFVWDGPGFGGLSGVVFGLFGYVWIKSRYVPTAGMYIDPGNVKMMLFWLVLCMTGMVGRIANAAHLVGLLGGVAVAFAPVAWRRFFGR